MAIVKLKKLTLCGLINNKDPVLNKLQAIGSLHLIPLSERYPGSEPIPQEQAECAYNALKYLNQCANKRHQVSHAAGFDRDAVVTQVMTVKAKLRQLTDERDFLAARIKEIRPWGDFVLPREEQLDELKFWFYIVPNRLMKKVREAPLVWEVVHKDNLNCYVVVISACEPPSASMPVARSHTGQVPLSELTQRLNKVELELEDVQAERESLTRWIWMLTLHLAEAEDYQQFANAQLATLDRDGIFAVQGWVPESELKTYSQLAGQLKLACLIEDPDSAETPPTLLENNAVLAGGEEVVKFYQTPNYHEWDPSAVVFFSFALFFAMILSDAGYALLFALLLAAKWRSMGQTGKSRRLRLLCLVTVGASILWGVLIGSYFGYSPPQHAFAGKLKIFDINDFATMMHLSIAIGVLHIVIANLINAVQSAGRNAAYASVGWALLALAGYVMWVGMARENQLMRQAGGGGLVFAIAMVIVFSSERVIRTPVDLLMRLVDGVTRLTGITKIFGDVLSYMRLFALGLASASLALTFNQLAMNVYHSVSGPGLLYGILILLLGHALNILLCLMSGVVHGLRLNFIEFYNWSVSEEGYPFKAFSKKGIVNE